MKLSRVQNLENSKNVSSNALSSKTIPKKIVSGVSAFPDRLERSEYQEGPPSLFKQFLFDPIVQIMCWFLRGIFIVVDFLRSFAFGDLQSDPSMDRRTFLNQLRSAPSPEQLLHRFDQVFTADEKNRIYQAIGEACEEKISFREMIWERTAKENLELGHRLVRQNPFLLRDYL